VDDLRHRQTMASPEADTKTDSVRDMAKEQFSAKTSLRYVFLEVFLGAPLFLRVGMEGGMPFGISDLVAFVVGGVGGNGDAVS
jgi:hypothetical protein